MAEQKRKKKLNVDVSSGQKKNVFTDYRLLKKMWDAGASYSAMAEATDAHYDPERHDATKATRHKIWRARHKGVWIDGNRVIFGERPK